MREGFETFRAFAPPGWEPPGAASEADRMRDRLADPQTWCLVAEETGGGGVAGHVGFFPAALSRDPHPDPGLVHLWQLFVRPAHWGTGLAADLLARAIAAATDRGYAHMRLFTPGGQSRARRFYEREGFLAPEPPFPEPVLGLEIVEYRRALDG